MSDDLVNFVAQQMNSGHKVDQIESHLKSYGYDKKDVETSVKEAVDLAARSYIDYIDQLIGSGYSLAQVRSELINKGYDYRVVDQALNHYHKNFFSLIKDTLGLGQGSSQRKKQEEEIKALAEQGLSYGLTLENIQSNLISQGHDFHLVHKVVNNYRQSHFHVPKQAIFIFVLIAALGGTAFFLMVPGDVSFSNGLDMQERLLDLESENSHPNRDLEPGDELYYSISATQMGFDREFDIDFTYMILDQDENVMRRTRDTKAVVSNLGGSITLPSDLSPGRYEFKAIADYKGEVEARTSFDFDVVSDDHEHEDPEPDPEDADEDPEDVPDDPEPEDDEDEFPFDPEDEIGEPEPEDMEEDIPDVEDSDFDPDDFDMDDLSDSSLLLASDRERLSSLVDRGEVEYATYLCSRIRHDAKRDECKTYVAVEARDRSLCDDISSTSQREICYLRFAEDSTSSDACEDITISRISMLCRMQVMRNKNLELHDIEDRDEYMRKIAEMYG